MFQSDRTGNCDLWQIQDDGSEPIPGTYFHWSVANDRVPRISLLNPGFELDRFTNHPGYCSLNGPMTGWMAKDGMGINPIWPSGDQPLADNGAIPQGSQVAFLGQEGALRQQVSGFVVGAVYQLHDPVWSLAAWIISDGSIQWLNDPAAGTDSQRFYRVVRP